MLSIAAIQNAEYYSDLESNDDDYINSGECSGEVVPIVQVVQSIKNITAPSSVNKLNLLLQSDV